MYLLSTCFISALPIFFFPWVTNDLFCCKAKHQVVDDGKLYDTRHESFLRHVSTLADTPDNNLICPDGEKEVFKRTQSEETRIKSRAKVASLINLQSNVFNSRSEKFHVSPECAELTSLASDSWAKEQDANDYMYSSCTGMYLNEFTYETGSFVAVLSGDTYCLF